ncbi:MAG TPA: protein kinase [Candidatus Acidoferrales bacterium]|nr:protein kinase [Candidatus Acidoferrales bacterium]
MDQPTKPNGSSAPSSSRAMRGREDSQKTVLLSDIPDAQALVDEAAATSAKTSLTTSSLAALSQRYDILSEAGHGNMGNVYKARDRETGEIVALKLIKPEIASDQAMMERFKNELLFARRITHKNVCRVYDFNRIGGVAYTSMEFVEGESLRSVLNRFGGLPVRKGIDLATQICSGLKEAHAQGIVHRDLKPENVMIDKQGNVKIMDFGIARSMEAGTRLTGAMIGTPAYMAPEQVAGKPVDYRTDIYSLGLMLYEMFTGSETFHADTAVAVAVKQMQEAPRPPHEIDPNIPVFIERAILKCLEKDPAKRFQSIGELETALRATRVTGATPASAVAAIPVAAAVAATPMSGLVKHSTAATVAVAGTLLAASPKAKKTSPIAWVLVGAVLVLATLGGLRAMTVVKTAKQIPAPEMAAAPTPPAKAFVIPPRPAPQPRVANAAAAVHPKLPAQPPATPVVFPHVEYANKPATHTPQKEAATGPIYIWIGRFEKEERAQNVSRRIESHGNPVVVLPKPNPKGGQYFVVFTGPYNEKKAQNVQRWLESQGFFFVHQVRAPAVNRPEAR